MTERRGRTERAKGVKVVLGPRDEALLAALTRFQIARTSDLTSLFFHGARSDTAARRLRQLFDASFVDVHGGGLHEESVYSLAEAGRSWAEARELVFRRVPARPWDHHLGIVRAWTRLARALHAHPTLRLLRVDPDWTLRREFAGGAFPIVPDAAAEIERRRGGTLDRIRVALEIDLGSERRSVFERKIVAYEPSIFFNGVASETVLLAVVLANAGSRRMRSLEQLVVTRWRGASLVCDQQEWPEALISRLTGPDMASLTDSPSGKGRQVAVTPCAADTELQQGEGPSR